MNVIMGFEVRQREGRIKYERMLLRELAIENLKKQIHKFFGSSHSSGIYLSEVLEEGCFDTAIEAFLLGGHYSKFGYYGETEEMARIRCQREEKQLTDMLFNFILYWGKVGDQEVYNDGLYFRCSAYVDLWWKEGFQVGGKCHKLRMH